MRFYPKVEPKGYSTRFVLKFAWIPEYVFSPRGSVQIWLESYIEPQYWSAASQRWSSRPPLSNDHPDRHTPIWSDVPEVQYVSPWWWSTYKHICNFFRNP